MIKITIDDKRVKELLKAIPKQAKRATEQALDYTAVRIADEVRTQMLRRFDSPTQFTLNSLKVTKTKGHNMIAKVGFKEPGRMRGHYLLPQVEGGSRKLKGFERGMGGRQYVPGAGAAIDGSGNVKVSQIKAALAAVKSGSSAKYLRLTKQTGKLLPGVYQRVKLDGQARRKRGATLRGLRPILIHGQTGAPVRPLLPFYEIAHAEFARRFVPAFNARFKAAMR